MINGEFNRINYSVKNNVKIYCGQVNITKGMGEGAWLNLIQTSIKNLFITKKLLTVSSLVYVASNNDRAR